MQSQERNKRINQRKIVLRKKGTERYKVASFENGGRGSWVQKRRCLEAGAGKEMDSPLEPPKQREFFKQ